MSILTVEANVIYEVIGYLASAFVLFSFLMKDVKSIRLVNIFGAIFCVIYGILTHTWATATMNFILIFVHLFYFIKYFKDKKKNQEE